MIHNHERLLVSLVKQYYGLVPSLTTKSLLHHGMVLMKQAQAYNSMLSSCDFKKGIDILVRCNLARLSQVNRRIVIEILPERLISLLYYPHYLVVVNKRFGVASMSLLRTLMLYGNLSIEDLIERTLYHIIHSKSVAIDEGQIKVLIEELFVKFKELHSLRVVASVSKPDRCPEQCDAELIYSSLKSRFADHKSQGQSIQVKGGSVWTMDCDILNYLLLIELFPYFVKQPFANEEVTSVFKLLLEMTFEKSFKMRKTLLPYQEVFNRYPHKSELVSISRLSSMLSVYSHLFAPNFIQIEREGCLLNFDSLLSDLVQVIIKEFVKKNFGENAVRVFGALLEEPCVFEHNLLNSLKMDTKELHRNLYQLDLNRMITISYYSETNQSTLSARNVRKAFSVNLEEVIDYILHRCHYSLYAVMHRRFLEMSEQKDLIARKMHIENYKKLIHERWPNASEEERSQLTKKAHDLMSEKDHLKAESMLKYDIKVNKVEYHLINYVFILNMRRLSKSQL